MILVRLLQPLKASLPIFVTLLGIATEVKLLQDSKVRIPMLLTLLGKVTEVTLPQPLKALLAMLVTPSGIIKSVTNSPFKYKFPPYQRGFEPNSIPHQAAISLIYTSFKLLQLSKALL